MTTGVIVLAHGSQRAESNAVFKKLVAKVKEKINYEVVRGAVMEFAAPKLSVVVEELVEQGIKQIIIMPLFLLPGTHVKQQLPTQIKKLREKYPQVKFVVGDSIGAEERLVDLISEKIADLDG